MNRFRPAAMAANGTIEVCAANGSQLLPKSRRRFASIDTVPAREGAPIAVFAQYPDRTVAHHSAGDAKMNTGEEERTQDQ